MWELKPGGVEVDVDPAPIPLTSSPSVLAVRVCGPVSSQELFVLQTQCGVGGGGAGQALML